MNFNLLRRRRSRRGGSPLAARLLQLLFLLASPALAGDAADAVRQAAEGWRQALIGQDKAALQRLLADDLTYVHAGGKTESKEEYIASVTAGPPRYESFEQSDTRIRVYGNVAVLSGYVDVKLAGRDSYRVRTLEIYMENGGRWQLVTKESVRAERRRPPG